MKVRYLKSATVAIEANGVKILTDPWLVDGEYYGSWAHYPPYEFDEAYFADVDFIYISHIHPDHFSAKTLDLFDRSIPVLTHRYDSPFLTANIERLGFTVRELPHNERVELAKGVHINILAADNCNPELCASFFGCGLVEAEFGSTQIDSLCVIDDGIHSVLNINDCPFALAKETIGQVRSQYETIDLLLVGYGGAGPYPQCFDLDDATRDAAADRKREQFLEQGVDFIELVEPRWYLPFAGTYSLSGRLASLHDHRGVPEIEDAIEWFRSSTRIDQQTSTGLLLNSGECIDLATEAVSAPYRPLDRGAKTAYINDVLAERPLDYEADPLPSLDELQQLVASAHQRLERKRLEIGFSSDTTVLVRLVDGVSVALSMKGDAPRYLPSAEKAAIDGYVEYRVDPRLLVKILRGPQFAHWNNAEIGSHIEFDRKPDSYERGLYHAMNYFHA